MSTNQQPLDPKDENPATDTSEQLESNEPHGDEAADQDLADFIAADFAARLHGIALAKP